MIYVFDLDNTICKLNKKIDGGWDYENALPIKNRIQQINELYDKGHQVIIDTARGSDNSQKWFTLTSQQLKLWGLKYSQLRVGGKFESDIYVDDKAINSEDFFRESKSNYLKQESGGKTNVVLVNRVYKEASDDRMTKLIDEYNFIDQIPSEFKKYFPKITFFKSDPDKAFYEMEHYDLPTIRRLMLDGSITKEEVLKWVKTITEVSMRLYKHEVIPTPPNYLETMHFERYLKREEELRRKSKWFSDVFTKDEVSINGEVYMNLPILINLFRDVKFTSKLKPEFVGRWSHSDLHFSNILIDRAEQRVIFIDPRGYDYCDYYYDFGKLWHSVSGKYEMIATHQFSFSEGNFALNQNHMFDLCESLKSPLLDILCDFSNETPEEVEFKTEWNEVMHFSSLIPFVLDLDGEDARAKVAYYTSVKLANDFCRKYGLL
jgi:hypothetical protein